MGNRSNTVNIELITENSSSDCVQENPYKDSEEICQHISKSLVGIVGIKTSFIVFILFTILFPFCNENVSLWRKEVIQTHTREMEVETSVGFVTQVGQEEHSGRGGGNRDLEWESEHSLMKGACPAGGAMARRVPAIKEENLTQEKDALHLRNLTLTLTCLYFATVIRIENLNTEFWVLSALVFLVC